MRLTLLVLAVVVVLALSSTSKVMGDGCYFPEAAHPKPPAIPRQRAVVVHRGGMERLVIESSLDADGQSFGWIIPVPAEPLEMARASDGPLSVLDHVTEPEVTHDLKADLDIVVICTIILLLLFLVLLIRGRLSPIPLVLLFLAPCVFIVPTLVNTKASEAPVGGLGVVVRQSAEVGNYDVRLLKASNAAALGAWLKENGFSALPDRGVHIAEDYIKAKWRL